MSSTIAAISTPTAVGGISLIRISGDCALAIAEKLFVPFGKTPVSEMAGHTCAYGRIVYDGETLDDVLLTVFRAPSSYTGEDTAEISCHGGLYVTKKVLRAAIALGAEPAAAGEFTKRAFLNGKLSLTQAEAVADIISAEGDSALKSANMMREGALFRDVKSVLDRLVGLLGGLAAWTDYPDEDIPETDPATILSALSECEKRLEKIIAGYDGGIVFREGVSCAIVGRPNVGKSTLMNALLGFERSIVTPAAGTTRDVVEEKLRLGDIVLRLSDTAGIRETSDGVEQLGVKLAERTAERAQLCFVVLDGSEPLTCGDREILKMTANRRRIVVINKCDLPQKLDREYFSDDILLEVSAKDRLGLDRLRDAVYEKLSLDAGTDAGVFVNERQKNCCDRALSAIRESKSAISAGETLDAVTVCIDAAADALLELTGEKATEAVVNNVFERFCVGK